MSPFPSVQFFFYLSHTCVAFEREKKKRDQELTRQKAVQKFTITQGHKFSAIKSYQVLKCAVCKDFLFSGQGLNCQMCDFTCHRRCEERVAPKCISLLSTELVHSYIYIYLIIVQR
jgi:hypothetical protein